MGTVIPQQETEAKNQSGAQLAAKLEAHCGLDTGNFCDSIKSVNPVVPIPFLAEAFDLTDSSIDKAPVDGFADLNLTSGAFVPDIFFTDETKLEEGREYTVYVKQHDSSARTLTWGSGFKFPADTPPVMTATLGKTDVYRFKYQITNKLGEINANKSLIFLGVSQDFDLA